MNVVRSAMPGTRSRSLPSSVSISFRDVRRRIASSTASLMCCSGMSMYFTTRGSRAIASIIASLKHDGYAYISRTQPPPSRPASSSSASSMPTSPGWSGPYPMSWP